jgi:hypothetical protein
LDEARVPTRWVKFVAGIFLLPICWITSASLFGSFTRDAISHSFWLTEEFWFFGIGALLWLIWFAGLPRPLMLYVFGHEITHAIWVWLMGGKVTRIEFGEDGGQIFTNKTNFLIALAPYFFPIYSVIVLGVYAVLGAVHDMSGFERWMLALLGATWSFHLTFTFWMIPRQQTDLIEHGTFFSIVVIYLMNLVVLAALFISASPSITWTGFATEWMRNAEMFSVTILDGLGNVSGAIFGGQARGSRP